jgi:hypothetical protein
MAHVVVGLSVCELRTNLTSSMRLRSHTKSRRLPPELIEHTIDYLHDSAEDLRSCALACKAWLAPSRFHLFYQITLHREPILPSCRRLQRAIQHSSDIALCVRELSFTPEFSDFPMRLEDSERVELNTILPQIFRSFTRLRRLLLRSLSWGELMSDVKKSFQDILTLPSLVHLHVAAVEFSSPESFLDLLHPQLKRLEGSLFPGTALEAMNREDEQETVVKRSPCRLEYLWWYSRGVESIDRLLGSQSIIDISALRTLRLIDFGPLQWRSVTRLLGTLRTSLEHLIIEGIDTELWGASPIF